MYKDKFKVTLFPLFCIVLLLECTHYKVTMMVVHFTKNVRFVSISVRFKRTSVPVRYLIRTQVLAGCKVKKLMYHYHYMCYESNDILDDMIIFI